MSKMLPVCDIFINFAGLNLKPVVVARKLRQQREKNDIIIMRLNDITRRLTPATLWLLVANVVMFVATILLKQLGVIDLRWTLGAHYWGSEAFGVYQLLTSMFLHADLMHLFFNMFALFTFGPWVERAFGTKRFLVFYFVCGLGAGLVQELVWQFTWQSMSVPVEVTEGGATRVVDMAVTQVLAEHPDWLNGILNSLCAIGASGAMFGVMLAFAVCFPNVPLYLFFIPVPIKAKWAVLGYGALELAFGVSGTFSGVAHFAHLGGLLFGGLLIIIWLKTGTLKRNPYYGNT